MNFAIDLAAVAVVIGVVNALKPLGVNGKFSPALSLILGLGYGIIFRGDSSLTAAIHTGLLIGLSACGLYSGTKAITKSEPDAA